MKVPSSERVVANDEKSVVRKISLIIPITERHDDMVEIYQDYKSALRGLNTPFEMIAVVDGEFDKAYQQLKTLKSQGENLIIIKHARMFGESTAIMAGFRISTGDVILLAPPYHQVDMSDLPTIMESLDRSDMVVVRRWPRIDSRLNQFQTNLFHYLVRPLAGKVTSDLGCGVRMFRREVLDEIPLYGDLHRFLPILAFRQGFKIREVDARQSHKEKRLRTYPPGTYLRRLIDLLTVFFLIKFTRKPLRFFGLTGTAVLVAGLAITCYLVVGRLFFHVGLSDRPLFLVGILFVVLGLQIFAIGLIGELIIFIHARDVKDYQIEQIIN